MATAKTTIELNGKLYDARTGKMLGAPEKAPVTTKAANPTTGMVVDGFVRRSHAPRKPSVARTAPAPAVTKLERSKTLMRPAVRKPKPVVDAQPAKNRAQFAKQDPTRHSRAASIPKSNLVQKFNTRVQPHRILKKEASLPVVTPTPVVSQQLTSKVAHLATSTEAHVKQSVDIIEESLRSATSHLEQFEGRVAHSSFLERVGFRNKLANLASLSFAGLLLVGFFAYQNAPNIEMRVAAARSGVSAQLPDYSPSGFSAARNITAEPGKVMVTYKSNTDDKKFQVTQQASNWSSDSLLSNHVLASKQPYQTYQDAGKTVFIYDNSNATWVNRGIWYRVDGNASLTSDQLLRIANSM